MSDIFQELLSPGLEYGNKLQKRRRVRAPQESDVSVYERQTENDQILEVVIFNGEDLVRDHVLRSRWLRHVLVHMSRGGAIGPTAFQSALLSKADDAKELAVVSSRIRLELHVGLDRLTTLVQCECALEQGNQFRLAGRAARLGIHDGCVGIQRGRAGTFLFIDERP